MVLHTVIGFCQASASALQTSKCNLMVSPRLFKKFQLSDAYSLEIPLQTQKYVCEIYRKGLNIRFEKKQNRNQGR